MQVSRLKSITGSLFLVSIDWLLIVCTVSNTVRDLGYTLLATLGDRSL